MTCLFILSHNLGDGFDLSLVAPSVIQSVTFIVDLSSLLDKGPAYYHFLVLNIDRTFYTLVFFLIQIHIPYPLERCKSCYFIPVRARFNLDSKVLRIVQVTHPYAITSAIN